MLSYYQVSNENDSLIEISIDDFNKINQLYKFIHNKGIYFDKKRNKIVAKLKKNLLNNKDYYTFSKNWLRDELISTNSSLLLDIIKNNIHCYDIFTEYNNKKLKDKQILLKKLYY